MKTESNWGDTGRTIFVFFFTLLFLSFILHLGMGLDPTGDEQLDRELRVEIRWLGIPMEWVVLPFVVVSAILVAWIDSRQRERRRATRRE